MRKNMRPPVIPARKAAQEGRSDPVPVTQIIPGNECYSLSGFTSLTLTGEKSIESRQIAPFPGGQRWRWSGGQTVLLSSPRLQFEESHGDQTVELQLGRDVRLVAVTDPHHLAQHAQYDEEGPGPSERKGVPGQTDLSEVVSHPLQPGPHYDGPQQRGTAREEVEGEGRG